jgi:hypothetical protein
MRTKKAFRRTLCEHAGLVALLVLDTIVLKQALKGLPIGRVVVIPRQGRLAVGRQRWSGEFGQVDKWKICLKAARMPRIRSDHGKTNTPDPCPGI